MMLLWLWCLSSTADSPGHHFHLFHLRLSTKGGAKRLVELQFQRSGLPLVSTVGKAWDSFRIWSYTPGGNLVEKVATATSWR